MYTCIRNAITEREVRGAVSLGSVTLGDLKRDLGIATCCGNCEPDAKRILRESRAGCAAAHAGAAGD